MKKILILSVLLVALLTACGKANNLPDGTTKNEETLTINTTNSNDDTTTTSEDTKSSDELKASDFLSYEKDVYMKFRGTGNEYAEYETYVDYVKDDIVQLRNINPGTTMVFVYQYKNGELKKLYSHGETYYNFDFTDFKDKDKEEVLIKEPIKVGTKWELADKVERSITAVDKEINLPAGIYKALEITTVGSDYTIKDYYVKEIGHVKSKFATNEDDEYKVVSELEKLEKNVAQKKSINFYFADFKNDRIVYENREFNIKTNQDILNLLQEELKKAPEGDELKGTLTANANILGIKIDDEKGIVTVDFTPQLISEMNAGTSYESMIINSIVNTIGDYFLVDKVIITVEGKPYSSGHVLMKEGEYFKVTKDKAIKLQD